MDIQRIAAFSNGNCGGNPAGVVITDKLPTSSTMQKVAADVGFSETVFAAPEDDGFIVRYFSPETEIPFCGHATIALGAALTMRAGEGIFKLRLAFTKITVHGKRTGDLFSASLQSPNTKSATAGSQLVRDALELFGIKLSDLDKQIPPAIVEAGATHLVLALKDRTLLSNMDYDLDAGRLLMKSSNLVTINLITVEANQLFHSRNAFASGGVLEDPATGAAAAALAGYLRDINWPHNGEIDIIQGEDMGMESRIKALFSDLPGSSVRVSGTARLMEIA